MPTYSFRNKTTGETYSKFLTLKERESYLENNPDVESIIDYVVPSSEGIGHLKRNIGSGWKDVLRKIKDRNPGSNINV
jgi:hypothetical protein